MLVPSIALCSWVGFAHWTEPSDSGPTTPLPNKKLLLFILDRLQKWVAFVLPDLQLVQSQLQDSSSLCVLVSCRKDTYGVFSEPVDPEEVCLCFQRWWLYICLVCWFWFLNLTVCLFMCIYGQLPDYHDIIKHPMDFSTIRKKLDKGAYSNLEQFEVGHRICLDCLCFSFVWIFLQPNRRCLFVVGNNH